MKSILDKPISIIMGEPSGIGPEIIIKSWLKKNNKGRKFFVIGNYKFFLKWKNILNSDIPIKLISSPEETEEAFKDYLPIIDIPFYSDFTPGFPSDKNSESIIETIKSGVEFISLKKSSSIITCPIQKNLLYKKSFPFPGITEFLGSLTTQKTDPTMLLYSPKIKVILVTTHIPLRDVSKSLDTKSIYNKIKTASYYLKKYFCIDKPNIAVAGLNPHLGEVNSINNEEIDIIKPAIEKLTSEGVNVQGPLSSDSIFFEENRKKFDLIVCMYHDQGLIPIKTIDFWKTVNVTLGLPFLRISPDHGTALDIAGQGISNPSSLLECIDVSNFILDNQKKINV